MKTPPRSFAAASAKIKEILKMGMIPIPDKKSYRGTGAPGRLLEDLLGIAENNHDSPDLQDWEVKFHGGGTLITLFHKDPEPRGITRFLIHDHGWPDGQGRISFRHTISGKSDRGFYVVNDPDRVIVRHETKDTHPPFWRHNTLLGAAGAKLRRLILVDGKVTHESTGKHVEYKTATAFWDFNLTGFCDALEKGDVCIDFDARTNAGKGSSIRNHGAKFRVHLDKIGNLFEHSKKIT